MASKQSEASKLLPLSDAEGQGEGEVRAHNESTGSASAPTQSHQHQPRILAVAAWHSLAWLVIANGIGLLLATLLLFPGVNGWLGEFTYGRWMPLHLNLQLYGWCSLPLVAWLFKTYRVHCAPASRWGRTTLWMWSAALVVGAVTWLTGHSSGKLFLDWTGYSRILFPLALCFLWLVLAGSLKHHWRGEKHRTAKIIGLIGLLTVPPTLYWAASPHVYPAINPVTGGPTGASLLDSTLGIVLILLLLPVGLGRRQKPKSRINRLVLGWYGIELLVYLGMGHHDSSNHWPSQFLGLGSLLPWMVMMPLYYQSFDWPRQSRRWRISFLSWWLLLLASGWFAFLPGVLDHLKFTDGLVAHSHLAMAGFVSSLNLFLLANFLDHDAKCLNSKWAFIAWQTGLGFYVVAMAVAGWIEGGDPAFTIVPGVTRNALYAVRLAGGALMFSASVNWLAGVTRGLAVRHRTRAEIITATAVENQAPALASANLIHP
jgi:cytochrome c oxidase cbb3-type subunit 1